MYEEPETKRAVAFVDGANTRLSARKAFGDGLANINPLAMIQAVCSEQSWDLAGAYYYLGVPDVRVTEDGYYAWMKRCARWRRQGVRVFTRTLLNDDSGSPREKGIDIRLALDAVDLYRREPFDVAILFSQDQDFSELAAELKTLAREQGRWIEIVSAFPWSEKLTPTQGISGTRPVVLGEALLRETLDTVENRALRFTALPSADTPPPIAATPVFLPPEPEAQQIIRVPVETRPALAATPRPPLWLSLAALLYLTVGVATFAFLALTTDQAPVEAHIRVEVRLSNATQTLAQAALWPLYWSQSGGFDRVAAQAAARASSFEIPLLHGRSQ